MTAQELTDKQILGVVNLGGSPDRQITASSCCDLLSIAVGCVPAGCAWVAVTANTNTLATTALIGTAYIILTKDAALSDVVRREILDQEITMLSTNIPVLEAASKIHSMMS